MKKTKKPTTKKPPKKPAKKTVKKTKKTNLADASQHLKRFAGDLKNYGTQNYLGDPLDREVRFLVYTKGKRPIWQKKPDYRKKMIPGIFEKADGKFRLLERMHKDPAIYRKRSIASVMSSTKEAVQEGVKYEAVLKGKTMLDAIAKISIDIPANARLAVVATVTGEVSGNSNKKTSAAFVEEFRYLPLGTTKIGMLHAKLARELNKAMHSRKWVFTTHREIEKIHTRETVALNKLFARYGAEFDDSWSIGRAKYELATLAGYGEDNEDYDRVRSRNVVSMALKSSRELKDSKFLRDYKFLADHYVNEGLLELTDFDQFENVVINIAISHIPEQKVE